MQFAPSHRFPEAAEASTPRRFSAAPEPRAINVGAVRLMAEYRAAEIPFGRGWIVPRIPYLAGLEIGEIQQDFREVARLAHEAGNLATKAQAANDLEPNGDEALRLSAAADAKYRAAQEIHADGIHRAVRVAGPLLRPMSLGKGLRSLVVLAARRLSWRLGLTRNPLRHRTVEEVAAVIGFLARIKMSLGRSNLPTTIAPNGATRSKTSQPSSARSRRGRSRAVARKGSR